MQFSMSPNPSVVSRLRRMLRRKKHRRLRCETLERRHLLAVLIVDSNLDNYNPSAPTTDGLITLREAVLAANNDSPIGDAPAGAGADTITFAAGAGEAFQTGNTIRLMFGEIEITDDLTIDGPDATSQRVLVTGDTGGDDATVEGITDVAASESAGTLADNSRIFNVTGDSVMLTLDSLTLTGGRTTGDNLATETTHNGGGIRFASSGLLTLNDSTVSGNSTAGDNAEGGGMYSLGANVTLTGSTVSGNSTAGDRAEGGGISTFRGNVTLTNSTVSGNSTAAAFGRGGGISTFDGDVTLTDSTVSGNSTAASFGSGGGIYTDEGNVTLTDSTVSGNSTGGLGSDGGGIHTNEGNVTLTASTVSGNSTAERLADGGGIRSDTGNITLTASTVSGNSTAGYRSRGGGIYTQEGSVTLTGSTVSGNRTEGSRVDGGGLFSLNLTIVNSTITGNVATGRGGGIGALVDRPIESLTIHNSIIAGNMDTGGNDAGPDFVAPGDPTNDLDVRNSLIGDSTGTTLTGQTNGNLLDIDWTTVLASQTVGGNAIPLLADNGGPTLTHRLMDNSPAIDAGDNALAVAPDGNPLSFDQRGTPNIRVVGSSVDMGAFEAQGPAQFVTITPGPVAMPEGDSGTTNFVFTVARTTADSESPVINYAVTGSGTNAADVDDFVGAILPSGTVTFEGTNATATITIPVSGDTAVETDEGFTVTLSGTDVVAEMSTATGTITNDDAASGDPVVNISPAGPGGAGDNADLSSGGQPTSWAMQRSSIRRITVVFAAAPASTPVAADLVMTNRTTDAAITLSDSQFSLDGATLTVSFGAGQLPDGVYDLTVRASLTGGGDFTVTGDNTNKLFVKQADWNGDSEVNLLDFTTFRYWFGTNVDSEAPLAAGTAPAYVDLNGDGEINLLDFSSFRTSFGTSTTFPAAMAPGSASVLADDAGAEAEEDATLSAHASVGESAADAILFSESNRRATLNVLAEDISAARVPSQSDTEEAAGAVDQLLSDDDYLSGLF